MLLLFSGLEVISPCKGAYCFAYDILSIMSVSPTPTESAGRTNS